MVVEDENDLREALVEALEVEGVLVYSAANGREALESLKNLHPKPCLILLDLMMPVMNGWQFLEERESRGGIRHIPVVVVSAFNKESITGVDQKIGKPINLDLLISIVKEYCKQEAA